MMYDVVIIGLGPAGYAAAIYAKRGGLNALVLEGKIPGGLLNYTNVVNNYPGFINISGPELSVKMFEHFKSFEIDFKNEDVIEVVNGDVKKVVTNKGEYMTKNVIIATGRSRRSLNLPGEKELMGHGISYCAMCDGHFYKDKDVIVVGAGDSSLEESLYLAKIVKSVTILVKGPILTGNDSLVESVEKNENIHIMFQKSVTELLTEEGKFIGVRLNDDTILNGAGLFVYIGFDPVIPFKINEEISTDRGYIIVDKNCMTNIEGVYAAGDIIKKDMYQIISAAYEGATAATSIIGNLTKKN